MHTQNVNVAASESPKTWVEKPESVYFSQKVAALIELAKIEGDMLFFVPLRGWISSLMTRMRNMKRPGLHGTESSGWKKWVLSVHLWCTKWCVKWMQ